MGNDITTTNGNALGKQAKLWITPQSFKSCPVQYAARSIPFYLLLTSPANFVTFSFFPILAQNRITIRNELKGTNQPKTKGVDAKVGAAVASNRNSAVRCGAVPTATTQNTTRAC
jgi:hypothetical protein